MVALWCGEIALLEWTRNSLCGTGLGHLASDRDDQRLDGVTQSTGFDPHRTGAPDGTRGATPERKVFYSLGVS